MTSEDFFKKIYLSFILKVCVWEGVGDRTELQYNDPHSYCRQRCVFLVRQGCSTRGPGAQLSAGWWLSLLHLITTWSPKLHRGSRGPLRPGVAFPTISCLRRLWTPTVWLPVLTELYNSSTPTQSPTQSLEWHVLSSSSRNNCPAVQRSFSSGASVYECIIGFYLVPFHQPNPPMQSLSVTGHWNVSLPSGTSLWNGMFGRVEGQYKTLYEKKIRIIKGDILLFDIYICCWALKQYNQVHILICRSVDKLGMFAITFENECSCVKTKNSLWLRLVHPCQGLSFKANASIWTEKQFRLYCRNHSTISWKAMLFKH